jgi:murein DD-endopeptidase MepM/ murein hydrolase activator NlpD
MIKALENYNQDDMNKLAKKTSIVRMSNNNKEDSQQYTLTKKTTTTISNDFVALTNAFNKILSSSININQLQDNKARSDQSQKNIQNLPAPVKIIGSEKLGGNLKILGKYFEGMTEILKKLDLTTEKPEEEDSKEEDSQGDETDDNKKKKSKKGKGKKARPTKKVKGKGLGIGGKALGVFAAGMDMFDRLGDGESVTEAGVGVAGGLAGGLVGAEAGAALGALGGLAAPLTVPLGGLVGGAIGYFTGGKIADTSYDAVTKESPADKRLESVASKLSVVPAKSEPTDISNNSYSSRFAAYLNDTFNNVKNYITGMSGASIDSSGSGDEDFYYEGGGAGMTANAQFAIDFFMTPEGGSWTREQAAGIVGNLQAESELNPNAFNEEGGGRGAVGIAQWRGVRQTRFEEKYGRPIRGSSLQQQLDYVNWELNNVEKPAGNALRNAKTVQEAASIFYRKFERPGKDDISGGKRMANAVALMTAAPSNNPAIKELMGGQLMNPLPSAVRISSGFGMRNSPTSGASKNHKGIDLAAPNGSPILAAGSGRVTFAGQAGGAGNMIQIDHGSGLVTEYMHMASFTVRQGMDVEAGQKIGGVGSTGTSTGNHLHFAVKLNGTLQNPLSYITGPKQQNAQKIFNNFQQPDLDYYNKLKKPRKKLKDKMFIITPEQQQLYRSPTQFSFGTPKPRQQNPNPRGKYLGYHNQ